MMNNGIEGKNSFSLFLVRRVKVKVKVRVKEEKEKEKEKWTACLWWGLS
jgi:hypothetical protein